MNDDPRTAPDFDAPLFPTCDSELLPADVTSPLLTQKLGLASCYYLVNKASSALREFRNEQNSDRDKDRERLLLQAVEEALLSKEAREDELAQIGICATPTLNQGIVVDLEFSDPSGKLRRKVVVPQSSTLSVDFDFDFPWDKKTGQP